MLCHGDVSSSEFASHDGGVYDGVSGAGSVVVSAGVNIVDTVVVVVVIAAAVGGGSGAAVVMLLAVTAVWVALVTVGGDGTDVTAAAAAVAVASDFPVVVVVVVVAVVVDVVAVTAAGLVVLADVDKMSNEIVGGSERVITELDEMVCALRANADLILWPVLIHSHSQPASCSVPPG
uniref:Uncharacterized protein n=1 Tax=Octopus bimaculoides TaxID=37653 RepID=A0A0L8HTK2_OCTBM